MLKSTWQCPYCTGDWKNQCSICEEECSVNQGYMPAAKIKLKKRGRPKKDSQYVNFQKLKMSMQAQQKKSKNALLTYANKLMFVSLSEKFKKMGIE